MKTKNLLVISMTLALLVGLFIAVSSALASDILCGSTPRAGVSAGDLLVKKTVKCESVVDWTWQILKSVDHTALTLSTGQSHVVNYTVAASAVSAGTYSVSGTITVANNTDAAVTGITLTDPLADQLDCTYNSAPVSFPVTLAPHSLMQCTYSGTDTSKAANNVARVSYGGNSHDVTVPIDWSLGPSAETNECADVTDTFAGALGNVCAGQTTSFTFNYSRTIGPFDVCGTYTFDNTATVTPTEGGPSSSSSASVGVTVPCAGGCTLTPGYWKTHSTFGPAPYDDTWAQLGESTTFFFSGKTYYQALWTSPQGNAYWILAHAYIAAKLNQLNGADFTAAQSAFNQATALFSNPTYTPAYIDGLKGSNAIRQSFITYATILDNYNNGLLGPGHCSE